MAYTLHSKFGRFNHKVFKRKNINLEEIHSDKTYLTSGIIHLHNNYLSFLTDGDIAGVQLEITGDVLFESQLDNTWAVANNQNKIIIYNMQGKVLPQIVFFYQGKFDVEECILTDYFGNTFQPYVVREKMGTDIINSKDLPMWRETAKNVEDSKDVGDAPIKKSSGVVVVRKDSLNQYKAKKLDEMEDFYRLTNPSRG